jgi:hypothetical protein
LAINHVQYRYPIAKFVNCDHLAIEEAEFERFGLIRLFNSFYAFAQQDEGLRRLRGVGAPAAVLRRRDA